MNAAGTREELEAALWRNHLGPMAVDAILTAADTYATATADERIAGHVHARTLGRERLADIAGAAWPLVHYRGLYGPTACRSTWKHHPGPVTAILTDVTCGLCKRSRGYKDALRETAA